MLNNRNIEVYKSMYPYFPEHPDSGLKYCDLET